VRLLSTPKVPNSVSIEAPAHLGSLGMRVQYSASPN
jgi:hypothetical protein